MSTRRSAFAMMVVALVGCGDRTLPPAGQVRIGIDTDALLPSGPGEAPPANPPLFDRLRVELFAPGETTPCEGCTREFGLDRPTVYGGRASFGVVPPENRSGYVARVRLFRSTGAATSEPRPTSTLETVIALPVTSAEGIIDVHVELPTTSLGTPVGTLDAPATPLPGPAKGGLAGTFAQDRIRGCASAPHEGEVCVPGGAYWMGDLTIGNTYGSTSSERLVVVSPFFMSETEVTIGQYRASGLPVTGRVIFHDVDPTCTFPQTPGTTESLPVNCVTKPAALSYCKRLGGTIPSEAQWEYIAGARRSASFVWGSDEPHCTDAIYGRTNDAMPTAQTGECLLFGKGPAAVGTGKLDLLPLQGGALRDVMGNLTEWMADGWAKQGAGCWKDALLVDPLCTSGQMGVTPDFTVRGGSFAQPGSQLRAAIRAPVSSSGNPFSSTIGFRCVRSDAP